MKKKVLLMGKSGSGKTSMRSIIFANYIARDTTRLAATIDVEYSHVRFLGNLALNLWDCGGQQSFMENYFSSQKEHIFRNASVLIYVFDVENEESEKEGQYSDFKDSLHAIQENSADARIFCLIHKMDLIAEDRREKVFAHRCAELTSLSAPSKITCFATSIWDESLYKAWSDIVYALIPNIQVIESRLQKFCAICEADEVVLFERATFLVISHAQTKEHKDVQRFEKISNIIKQFKLSCSKSGSHFQNMEVTNSQFSAFIEMFTGNTYVLVLMSNPNIKSSATLLNISAVRPHFERYLKQEEK
eukprot:TRINITY_DN2933_c0_g1_i1.p1 TRINITY_DN2933_c0_g1~~TRINITY_DN2933_c0_g1_i1.p1  ORF type:complete len:304 (-),score=58.13 TRINITY_DN2933_c0_g1_i1:111-1022(-)